MPSSYKEAYRDHKRGAKDRGIEFLLTYEEWLKIWIDSGHLHERGPKKGQYVMARFGDKGPYAVGNVKIITCSDNIREFKISLEQRNKISENNRSVVFSSERKKNISNALKTSPIAKASRAAAGLRRRGKRLPDVVKLKISKSGKGKKKSEAHRLAISKSLKGRKLSIEHRRNLSEAAKRRQTAGTVHSNKKIA